MLNIVYRWKVSMYIWQCESGSAKYVSYSFYEFHWKRLPSVQHSVTERLRFCSGWNV